MPTISRRHFVAASGAVLLSACTRNSLNQNSPNKDYDTVIVGAGSSGSVLASRLSANPNHRVLVLEAGQITSNPLVNDATKWFMLLGSDLVYPDMTTAQHHLGGKALFAGHGKAVGGSSVINAMIHHRPTPHDINDWGLDDWRWSDIEPMLRRSENYANGTSTLRGRSGPVGVMQLPDPPPLVDAVMTAADRLGIGTSDDINAENQMGAALNQLASADGKRQHTGHVYLGPALERTNLTVLTGANVSSLMINSGECQGLNYQHAGVSKNVSAGRVILCAGALRTPQLMMLSGIGPADELRSLGIDVKVDSPQVGHNLHDHLLISGNNFSTPQPILKSSAHGSVACVYSATEPGSDVRDILLNVSTSAGVIAPLEGAETGFKTSFSFTKPKSRGRLTLSDSNWATTPVIDLNCLSDEHDVRGTMAALALSRKLLSADEFKHFDATEMNSELLRSKTGIRELINNGATPFGHYSGTSRMGADDNAPVNTRLQCNGVSNLDIVDASIIPSVPSCPTNPLVIAIAELYAQRQL